MEIIQQKKAAKEFAIRWKDKGYEKGETQLFWLDLLQNVFGVQDPTTIIKFELPVKTLTKEKGSDYIDAYISTTKVLIEQKGSHVDLSVKSKQSDGVMLTPYQQARRYATGLPTSKMPRWIVVCNFTNLEVHDMEHPNAAPEIIQLADLEKEYIRLAFLVDNTNQHIKKELEVSIQAGEIVGVLYDKILREYKNPDDPESQKSLNKLCVRLVFCLYAEDAGIFGTKNMFHDYMAKFPASEFRSKLIELFRVLDTRPEERDQYMDDALAAFPYVNGGLFSGDIEIPRINDEIRTLILQRASDDFDWSEISPTIFGAVFESTLNPETRRSGGMHYTSIENIHKVIDPLFLNELKTELAAVKSFSVAKIKRKKALAFQNKLASLKFLDPACGSGNFLTESYISLRRIENEALRIIYGTDRLMGGITNPIKVSIGQFYGIEINDFACAVAQTALWIAELQMMQETDEIVGFNLDPLPLKTYTNIREGNALRMDWNEVVPADELNYIMGNPPFVGAMWMKGEKRNDVQSVFPECLKSGEIDYVAGWYAVAAKYIQGTSISCAFVSTNSICQGQQVSLIWKPLKELYGININFAYRTFRWDSEASMKAHVHCIIVGFSTKKMESCKIYDGSTTINCSHINGYLSPCADIFIEARTKPISNVPIMHMGVMARDGGFLILDKEEYLDYIRQEPQGARYIRRYMMGREFINNIDRYCFWLLNATPKEIRECPILCKKIDAVRTFRLQSKAAETRKFAETPSLFCQLNQPKDYFIAFPKVSSERRKYIPIGFLSPDTIVGDKIYVIEGLGLSGFGILTSSIHNSWMRLVGGRMKSDYSYSNTIIYNNFPWPTITEAKKEKITKTAQAILDARALYPDSSLADLYDEKTMPIELRKAHRANDTAVIEAYGFDKDIDESQIVTLLLQRYEELTN